MKDFRNETKREFKEKAKGEVDGSAVDGKLDKMAGNARSVPGGEGKIRPQLEKNTPRDRT